MQLYKALMQYKARRKGCIEVPRDRMISLEKERLDGADYSNRNLVSFSAHGARLEHCRFDGTRVENASFGAGMIQSVYTDCSFDRAHLEMETGGIARFVRCSFRDVTIKNWFCRNVELVDCVFSGRIQVAVFIGMVSKEDQHWVGRERNEFQGNDFSNAELVEVSFRKGIDLSKQRLPDGPEYLYLPDAVPAVGRAHAAVLRWHDAATKKRALTIIQTLQIELQGGQQQLFLRNDNFDGPREVVDSVFQLLKGDTDQA